MDNKCSSALRQQLSEMFALCTDRGDDKDDGNDGQLSCSISAVTGKRKIAAAR